MPKKEGEGGQLPNKGRLGTDVRRVQNLGRAKFLQKNLMPGQKSGPEIPNARARTSVPNNLLRSQKKEHLKKSGDTVMFQEGQTSVVAWVEKKGRKPVVIASTTINPTSPPVTVSRRKNEGAALDVPCPRSVNEYNENMGGVGRSDALRVEYHTARMTRRSCFTFFIFFSIWLLPIHLF